MPLTIYTSGELDTPISNPTVLVYSFLFDKNGSCLDLQLCTPQFDRFDPWIPFP